MTKTNIARFYNVKLFNFVICLPANKQAFLALICHLKFDICH